MNVARTDGVGGSCPTKDKTKFVKERKEEKIYRKETCNE
jgi:hypothetical protein